MSGRDRTQTCTRHSFCGDEDVPSDLARPAVKAASAGTAAWAASATQVEGQHAERALRRPVPGTRPRAGLLRSVPRREGRQIVAALKIGRFGCEGRRGLPEAGRVASHVLPLEGEVWRHGRGRLRALEDENRPLKRLIADQALDNQMLKEVLSRKW